MIELLIVILIIGILSALAFPVAGKVKRLADEAVTINNLKQISSATMVWAAEHGDKLPSPKYSGDEIDLPLYWTLQTDGEEGLWLNGVVFAAVYIEEDLADDPSDIVPAPSGGSNQASSGVHLVSTVFESRVSTLANPQETNWYKHSFAMNANLMYDEMATLRGLPNPWYSEKALSKFEPAAAMLFIDCSEPNVVMAEDLPSILETAEERYDGKRVAVCYLDGRVQKIHPDEIPASDPESDRESSLFWRGVLPD